MPSTDYPSSRNCVACLSVIVMVLLGSAWTALAVEKGGDESHSIAGQVVDSDGNGVVGVMVLVCQNQTGVPVMQADSRPFTDFFPQGKWAFGWAFVITDESGHFVIDGLKNGAYRLVAESWEGVGQANKPLINQAATEIHLRGVAENVNVPSEMANSLILRPLGEEVLQIEANSMERFPLLLLSSSAPEADPTLGNGAIVGGFMRHWVGGFPMKGNQVLVRGLPKGKLHSFLITMSGEPGFGAGVSNIESGSTVEMNVQIYATWVKPRPESPNKLRSLMNELRELRKSPDGGEFVAEQLPDLHLERFRSTFHLYAQLAHYFQRPIEMPSGRKTKFGQVMAAMQHLQIGRAVQRGADRTVEDVFTDLTFLQLDPSHRPPRSKANRSVSYEEAFRDLYDVLGKQYACFEFKGIDWSKVGREFLPRVNAIETDKDFGLLCIELVARLEDSHAQVMPGSIPLPQLEFPNWDPGFACLIDDQGHPVVYHVDAAGPAEKAGIQPGTTIISINGMTAEKALRESQAYISKYIGFSSSRYLRYQAARSFVRQTEKNGLVQLQLRDSQGKIRDIMLPASQSVRYLPRLPVPIKGIRESANVSWTMLNSGIGYIYVRRIRKDLTSLLDRAVSELQDVKGLIIDVRGNSGGGFDSQRAHLNFAFDRTGDEPKRPRYGGPITLLIDARCISAGEGWASWFSANKRARLFGDTTAGASARKTVYTLKNGLFNVRFSVKAYSGYLDRPIERRGLEPDVPLMPRAADLAKQQDTVLIAAEAYLLEREF